MISDMHVTHNAAVRIQQRGIPKQVIDWLLEFGQSVYQGGRGHCRIFYFTNRSRRKLLERLSAAERRLFEKKAQVYAVISEEQSLITVGYRTKRLPHK